MHLSVLNALNTKDKIFCDNKNNDYDLIVIEINIDNSFNLSIIHKKKITPNYFMSLARFECV